MLNLLLTRKQKNGSFLTRCFPLSLYLFTFIVFMPVVLDGHVCDVWIGLYLLEGLKPGHSQFS